MELITEKMLEVKNLSCIRDDRVLFKGLNFCIRNGQVLLLEGKNGSGKTSLLRIICGFRVQDEGELRWCNTALKDSEYFAQMAYVGHLDGVKKELTVIENLKMSLALSQAGRYSITQALKKVKLAAYDNSLVQSLSAGQKRRLSLARLLITKKSLWVLDEPFTSIDKEGIKLIESLMHEHIAQGGMIILTSHHDLNLTETKVQKINLSICH
ncbi:MAG: cytochrome c biogenesis heme-transporting ATPase CcmA [Methylococcales symbiont of Hymedesmia sp. n. MRB-2018]|nr:MAG: cytochrome c biogenesis heme-transporting ATPase CcmA [Methylococcales symbiont of Hymedesmia sp. n. MRB-2018]KAF3983204.1 MAG: cytochrome c biogenesis heme-transporting ATPase CcmA [Methylococcales symbiont of Hymedesmia sp. n. MRB-2018]